MAGEIKNKNNSNSNTSPAPNPIDFFYSHLEEMSLFGVATDESETIIIGNNHNF